MTEKQTEGVTWELYIYILYIWKTKMWENLRLQKAASFG